MSLSLRAVALTLGGEVSNGQVLAPGPGHTRRDRSLSLRLSEQWPGGLWVKSFAGDDWRDCKAYVFAKLGIVPNCHKRNWTDQQSVVTRKPTRPEIENAVRIARVGQLWADAQDCRNTIAETYLAGRRVRMLPGADVLRFHRRCTWRDGERLVYVPAMLAAMRSITSDAITGLHRTRLTPHGIKVERRMLGIAAGAAIKFDADEQVTTGLTVGEGVETCLAARQIGFGPVWALASAGAISKFPLLGGIETLTLLAENDPASERAIDEVADRWLSAGREVLIVRPSAGDMNDIPMAF